eukprot:1648061-Rhodomonas_salina.1
MACRRCPPPSVSLPQSLAFLPLLPLISFAVHISDCPSHAHLPFLVPLLPRQAAAGGGGVSVERAARAAARRRRESRAGRSEEEQHKRTRERGRGGRGRELGSVDASLSCRPECLLSPVHLLLFLLVGLRARSR